MSSFNESNNLFGEVIYAYSRADAIQDGTLVDVTEIAKKRHFKIPVAVTRIVWDRYIQWTDEDSKKQTSQDEIGRLHDILWMLFLACRSRSNTSSIRYSLKVIPRDGRSTSPTLIILKSVIHGGDKGEPVFTIMLPDED